MFLRIIENGFWIEVAHFSCDPSLVLGRIKAGDRANAALPGEKILPVGFEIVAQRRNDSHSRDDDPAVH
jgi:hypothetical protein